MFMQDFCFQSEPHSAYKLHAYTKHVWQILKRLFVNKYDLYKHDLTKSIQLFGKNPIKHFGAHILYIIVFV